MKLSRVQRSRLLAGDFSPLLFDTEPDVEEGQRIVLLWSRPSRSHDGSGNVSCPAPEPLLSLTVTGKVRRAKGGWAVRYDVQDRRESKRLVRSVPPTFDAELFRRDQQRRPCAEEIDRAAEESCYTANPKAAVDHLEAVSKGWKDRDIPHRQAVHGKARQDAQREGLGELHDRVRRLQEAAAQGADVRRQLAAIEQRVRAGENRLRVDRAA